jgi:hypothetical protein
VRFLNARWIWIVSLDVSIKVAVAWLISANTGFAFFLVVPFAIILSGLHLTILSITGMFMRLLNWPLALSRASRSCGITGCH